MITSGWGQKSILDAGAVGSREAGAFECLPNLSLCLSRSHWPEANSVTRVNIVMES